LIIQALFVLFFTFGLSGCSLPERGDNEVTANSNDGLILDEQWQERISGSPDVRLVSLPPNLGSYSDAWVYQFGDYRVHPDAVSVWNAHSPTYSCPTEAYPARMCQRHNMECGPTCVQIIERLAGRSGVTCEYQGIVAGCENYPSVHSACRAVGACGNVSDGYSNDSFHGTNGQQLVNVLSSLGYETHLYNSSSTYVNLDVVKSAIDANHPIIVAVSPHVYGVQADYPNVVDSHFVVVVGYGPVCKNALYDSSSPNAQRRGYIYMLDPGWKNGEMVCITEEALNTAIDEEWQGSSYTGIEVTRPGFTAHPSATWYPLGTLLLVDGEYYYVTHPNAYTGAMRLRHASEEALRANRISTVRAINAAHDVLSCAEMAGEMETAWFLREYRDARTGTIYLVNLATQERADFINYDAYLSFEGRDEWRNTTQQEIAIWSGYRRKGFLGLAPGTLVTTDAPGVSTVWVVTLNEYGRVRLPIFNEPTADIYGYDISKIGSDPRFSANVTWNDLDVVAGIDGQMLTEEMARNCTGRRCLAALSCFDSASSSGGGEDGLVGNGACGDCSDDIPDESTPADTAPIPEIGSAGAPSEDPSTGSGGSSEAGNGGSSGEAVVITESPSNGVGGSPPVDPTPDPPVEEGSGGTAPEDPDSTPPDQGTGGTPSSDPVTTPPANQGSGGSAPVDPVTCTDECTAGTIGCLNAQTVTTCVGPTVDIPCYHWLTTGSCATGETCIQDQGCFLCDVDGDGSLNATCGGDDCDDLDAARRPGQQESCDGMDNDCDFAVDEDIPSSGTCTSGIGACLRTGSIVCTGGAMHCDAVAGQPSAEICGNGVDEDCNGTPDNGCTPVCDPSDIACSTCYEPIRSSTNILCVDDEGRLFYRMDAFSYNGSLIPQSQIAAGLWHAYVWLDDEPWWIEMDLVPVAGISGALYAVLPQTLPSGLCPFGITPSRHPIRVSNPYRGTFVSGGTSFALDGTLRVCGDAQTGLTANFTYLNDCGIAVQRDGSGRWSPAAAQAEADMTGARIHCTP